MGENPNLHSGRWGGLITWWQDTFGRLSELSPEQQDPLDLDRPDAPSTPLPPDRPSGATPDRIEDAAQEFLTDWLVRRQYAQALEALSPRAYACLTVSDEGRSKAFGRMGACPRTYC